MNIEFDLQPIADNRILGSLANVLEFCPWDLWLVPRDDMALPINPVWNLVGNLSINTEFDLPFKVLVSANTDAELRSL